MFVFSIGTLYYNKRTKTSLHKSNKKYINEVSDLINNVFSFYAIRVDTKSKFGL